MPELSDLMAYLQASPSPYHAVHNTAQRLTDAGFEELAMQDDWREVDFRRCFVRRGGALVAWADPGSPPHGRFRVIGAHTDSPNLRVKPLPDSGCAGWKQLGVEVYGGALWNSWLDRDLGLSGRVVVSIEGELSERLLLVDRALARVPQLAIHLDRDVNKQGLKLNPQTHLTPVWGVGEPEADEFNAFVAAELDVSPRQVRGWDLMFHDMTPPATIGRNDELLASSRLDNLLSCWAGLHALLSSGQTSYRVPSTAVLCLFDHEEVGSTSATGADGALLAQVLERLATARGSSRDDLLRALSASMCASVDMAHATHPNHSERHDPDHFVTVGHGPVIKINSNQRYATDAGSHSELVECCVAAEVPHQVFNSRNDIACGSTIGPVTAAGLGMATADIGIAQLSMHSARELCGTEDPLHLVSVLEHFVRR